MKKILFKIATLHKLILRELLKNEQTLKNISKPSPTQIQIIDYLLKHQKEKVYQKDLEKILNLKRSTISGVLQTMEKNKIIERHISKEDSRIKEITLNTQAQKIHQKKVKQLHNIEQTVTQNINKEDLEKFTEILNKMINNIKRGEIK